MLSSFAMKGRQGFPGFSVVPRVAACLLLAVIATDLVGDAACDSFGLVADSATTVRAAATDGADDACVYVCVPDCFCCSRSVAAVHLALPLEPLRLTSVEPPAAERWPVGIRPVVDHPPLSRA